jgi:hypothetical protein
MIKGLGKLHPSVVKLQKEWEAAQGVPKKTLDELVDEWRNRGYDTYLMPSSLGRVLLKVLQPWRYRVKVSLQSAYYSKEGAWYKETPEGVPHIAIHATERRGRKRILFVGGFDISEELYSRWLWRRKK